jgi:hypothetical protein
MIVSSSGMEVLVDFLKYGSKRLNSFSTGAMISFFDAMQLLQFQLFIFCFLTAKWKRSSAKLIPA